MSSAAYNQAQARRAYREHIRERDQEIVIPALTDLEGRKKVKTQMDKNSGELVTYFQDVDKDISIYDRALFQAAKTVIELTRASEGDFSTVPLSDISVVRDSFFQLAYSATPLYLQPKQVPPSLDGSDEPAFTDEENAKQLNVIDAIQEVEQEKAASMPRLLRTCDTCGAGIDMAKPYPFAADITLISFTCGALIRVSADDLQQDRRCPDDARPTALIGMEPVDVPYTDAPEPPMVSADVADALGDLLEDAAEMFGSNLQAVADSCAKSDGVELSTPQVDESTSDTPAKTKRTRKKKD